MDETEIKLWIGKLEATSVYSEEKAWEQLKPLGPIVLPYFREYYHKIQKWQGRVSLVFHSIRYARSHEDAFQLGITALNDKAVVVRYRACMLLAYSLRKDALPHLEQLLKHSNQRTVQDAKAAIDAILSQNHHYFIDRDHSGKVKWNIEAEGA